MTTPPLTNENKTRLLAEAVGIKPDTYFRRTVWTYGGRMHYAPPAFLTDANAALTLVEHAKGKGWHWFTGDVPKGVEFNFTKDTSIRRNATAPTLPRAIAHAFARAFNLEGNWENGDL